jgi:hypothetical protein
MVAITAADLGEPWVENVKAQGYQEADQTSCARSSGKALDALVDDGRYIGPIFKRGAAAMFGRTSVLQFRDEAAALAYVELLRTETYQQCRVKGFSEEEAAHPGAPPGASWRLEKIGDPAGKGNDGYEMQLTFHYQTEVDGKLQDGNGIKEEVVYRRGAFVVSGLYEAVMQEGEDPNLGSSAFDEVAAAIKKALNRAPAT